MPYIPLILLEAFCIFHVFKTGQERYWFYIILMVPGVGALIYFLAIVVPGLLATPDGQRLIRKTKHKLDPEKRIRELHHELMIANTSQNNEKFADELASLGRYDEARQFYENALTGLFKHNPDIMLKLANAQFECGQFVACVETLDKLRQFNPDFQSQDGHLLYAKSFAEIDELFKAEDEFKVLVTYYTGPEARFCYYQLLLKQGRKREAKQQLEEILNIAHYSKPHYRRLHNALIAKANKELKLLD